MIDGGIARPSVARLDRPSGNVTGFADLEGSMAGKWLELLSEIAPGPKRAAIMFNPDVAFNVSTYMPSLEAAARSLKVEPIIAHVRSDIEIETAIRRCAASGRPAARAPRAATPPRSRALR